MNRHNKLEIAKKIISKLNSLGLVGFRAAIGTENEYSGMLPVWVRSSAGGVRRLDITHRGSVHFGGWSPEGMLKKVVEPLKADGLRVF